LHTSASEPHSRNTRADLEVPAALTPEIVTNISVGSLLGHGSGESIQLKFAGEGWVVVQPYEEVYMQRALTSRLGK
jgi:uncharacterized protein (AIM24 family)